MSRLSERRCPTSKASSAGESIMDISTVSGVLSDHDTASIAVHLEREFNDAQKVDFEVFVEAVMGHSPEVINSWTSKIREQNWVQDSKILQALGGFCAATSETGRYGPLSALITRMTELSRCSLPGVPETYPIDDICVVRNDPVCVQTIPEHGPLGAQRKPDLVMIRATYAKLLERLAGSKTPAPGIKWSHDISSWESKFKDVLTPRLETFLRDRSKGSEAKDAKINTKLEPLTTRRKRTSEDSFEEADRKSTPPQPSSSTTVKPGDVREGRKDAKVQLGSYALETLACTYGTRLFCVNVLMDDDRIHLWYYDACGIVRTKQSISLIDDFEKTTALIVGLASCPPERLGALPSCIQPPISAPYPASWPPENLKDHTLSLDRGAGESGVSITLKDPVFTQYSLTGRRTFVYNVESNTGVFKGDMIAKLSYQISTRPREQDLVKVARTAGVKHLPQIHFSGDLFRMSDGVRRIFFEQGGIEYEDRTLRMIVYSRYFPLQSLIPKRPECLQEMVVQIVNCLYDLKEKANILHRDISVNNIMYELQEGEPYFILIDYDMAIILSSQDDEPRKPHSRYREGTLPFMAADLVRNLAPMRRRYTPHYLRHDLESLFWLCVWCIAALAVPTNQQEIEAKERNVAIVRAWETKEFEPIAEVKDGIIRSSLHEKGITLIGKATCLRSWFRAWSNFWWTIDASLLPAVRARSDAEEIGLPPPTFDFETVNGLFTRTLLLSVLRKGQEEHGPSHTHNDALQRTTTLLSHVFPRDHQPLRRSTRATTTKTAVKEPQTARRNQISDITRTTVRKASTRKIERARGKSPPTSPTGRKKTLGARSKVETAKVAKKTTVRKTAAAKKGTTKAARATTTSVKDVLVQAKDAGKLKKHVQSQTVENESTKKEDSGIKGSNTRRRGKVSNALQKTRTTSTTTKRVRNSAKDASTKTVQAEANATKKASTKKATSRKNATRKEVNDEDKEGGKEVIEAQSVQLDENDIRRRLRPRKRT